MSDDWSSKAQKQFHDMRATVLSPAPAKSRYSKPIGSENQLASNGRRTGSQCRVFLDKWSFHKDRNEKQTLFHFKGSEHCVSPKI